MRTFLAIFLLVTVAARPALAQGEHARRVAAELLVMLGDARALSATPALSQDHQRGLNDRLRGGLSALGILMRLADQESGRDRRNVKPALEGLRASLDRSNLAGFTETLSELTIGYPLTAKAILPAAPTPARLKRAKEIHETLCAACHDAPDSEVARPAYNLFGQAASMSPTAFTARMVIGVRGDATTGLGNPLTDEELAGLIAYYRSARPVRRPSGTGAL